MWCSECHADNPPENRFCEQCGARLEAVCPHCGAVVRPGTRFCGRCGTSFGTAPATAQDFSGGQIPAAPAERRTGAPVSYTPKHLAEKILTTRSALEGERRQVTVLFADMEGFTALAEQLDPEEVHQIINRCFELITTEVHGFEGTINQYTGDGVMALFGAPIAHEDGPRRAIHAALAIQQALRHYGEELRDARGFGVQMRIGLNTGTVVVGKIGDDLRMDYTAVGDTTNLAARLQQAAVPGSVLISAATHKLVAGFFETRDLGTLQVKGHSAPVRAFKVLRARGRRARLDVAAERGLTPLVGRDRELATLTDLFQQVKGGHGQVVFIAGDAGIGKSRLVLELRRQLANTGEQATWLEGRCVSFGQAIPFLPITDQLRANFGIEESDGEPEIIAKVETGMHRLGVLDPHIPFIRYLLAVDPGEPGIAVMDPAARRKKTFDALWAMALRGASVRPIVFVYEDVHWIDTSTQDYLGAVIDSVAGAPVMAILTYRLGYSPPFGSRSFHSTLSLRSLSASETAQMAGRVLGTTEFPAELHAALMEKAEGVPLFIEEVTKTLLDLGILRRTNGSYRMVKGIEEVNVPETIHGIIMARLDRLGESGKRTVQLASVIGRQFLQRLLERVAGLPGQLDGLLRELKALEIVYEQGLLPEPAYVFKHAVIQDVAYNSLLMQRRKELHGTVAVAIEELYPDRLADHYGELAYHFRQADEWLKAMEYGVLAGDLAAHAFANVEAKQHYERALQAAERATPPPAVEARVHMLTKQAGVLAILGEYNDALTGYQQALQLIRSSGDQHKEIETLIGLSDVYNLNHEGEPALEYNEHALAIARTLHDRGFQAVCLANRVQLQTAGFGKLVESTRDAEEALRLSKEIGNPRGLARALVFLGGALQWRADFDRGLVHLYEGVEVAERAHEGFFFGYGAFMIGNALQAKGKYDEALRWYRRLSDYASGAGDKFYLARVPNLLGGMHLDLFDFEGAIRANLEAEEIARTVWRWAEPRAHALLKVGLGYLQKGEFGRADDFFRRTWALYEQDVWNRWRWHIALLRARGQLALATGRYAEAERYAAESLQIATKTDSRKHVARARRLQGDILAATGYLEEAAETLREAVELAEHLHLPNEVWTGKAARARLQSRLGKDDEAALHWTEAAATLDGLAANVTTPTLRRSFLSAEPVLDVYRTVGQQPPTPDPRT